MSPALYRRLQSYSPTYASVSEKTFSNTSVGSTNVGAGDRKRLYNIIPTNEITVSSWTYMKVSCNLTIQSGPSGSGMPIWTGRLYLGLGTGSSSQDFAVTLGNIRFPANDWGNEQFTTSLTYYVKGSSLSSCQIDTADPFGDYSLSCTYPFSLYTYTPKVSYSRSVYVRLTGTYMVEGIPT